jgi:hypothetical protein
MLKKLPFDSRLLLVIIPVALILVELDLYLSHLTRPKTVTSGKCDVEESTLAVDDPEMAGVLSPKQKVTLDAGWYQCHPLVDGELVYYRFSQTEDPVVRIVRAVEGDTIKLEKDKKNRAWNLLVNNKTVTGADAQGDTKDPYMFGNQNPPVLSLYLATRKDGLLPGDVILFTSRTGGTKDSAAFGLANVKDVVGKITPIK